MQHQQHHAPIDYSSGSEDEGGDERIYSNRDLPQHPQHRQNVGGRNDGNDLYNDNGYDEEERTLDAKVAGNVNGSGNSTRNGPSAISTTATTTSSSTSSSIANNNPIQRSIRPIVQIYPSGTNGNDQQQQSAYHPHQGRTANGNGGVRPPPNRPPPVNANQFYSNNYPPSATGAAATLPSRPPLNRPPPSSGNSQAAATTGSYYGGGYQNHQAAAPFATASSTTSTINNPPLHHQQYSSQQQYHQQQQQHQYQQSQQQHPPSQRLSSSSSPSSAARLSGTPTAAAAGNRISNTSSSVTSSSAVGAEGINHNTNSGGGGGNHHQYYNTMPKSPSVLSEASSLASGNGTSMNTTGAAGLTEAMESLKMAYQSPSSSSASAHPAAYQTMPAPSSHSSGHAHSNSNPASTNPPPHPNQQQQQYHPSRSNTVPLQQYPSQPQSQYYQYPYPSPQRVGSPANSVVSGNGTIPHRGGSPAPSVYGQQQQQYQYQNYQEQQQYGYPQNYGMKPPPPPPLIGIPVSSPQQQMMPNGQSTGMTSAGYYPNGAMAGRPPPRRPPSLNGGNPGGVGSPSSFVPSSSNTSAKADSDSVSVYSNTTAITSATTPLPVIVHHENLEAYRQEVKKSKDPVQQFEFAKQLVLVAEEMRKNPQGLDPQKVRKNRDILHAEALKWIKKAASATYHGKTGLPMALFYLADCYGNGNLGLTIDHERAFGYYSQGAKHDHPASIYRTGVCYEVGAGPKRDHARACQYYKKAAALGDTAAMFKAGMILLEGSLGQTRNPREGVNLLKRAAAQADETTPYALHELAILYEGVILDASTGVVPDPTFAYELYLKSAKLGYAPSQYKLGLAHEYGHMGLPIDARRSIAWYTKAAQQSEAEAELALSGWYLTGYENILIQSDVEAYLWARKAADKGLAKAEYAVAYFLEHGVGRAPDLEEARKWYVRAAGQGNVRAIKRLQDKGEQKKHSSTTDWRSQSDAQNGQCSIQ